MHTLSTPTKFVIFFFGVAYFFLVMSEEKFTFFYGESSPFSNWHPAKFTVGFDEYNCGEQHMMHEKARMFGDLAMAKRIMACDEPRKMKALGRLVHRFNGNAWRAQCKPLVRRGQKKRFRQNPHLLRELMKTSGTTLVEASPYDRFWGIGLRADDPDANDRTKWRGQNVLGQMLTEVREELAKEMIRGQRKRALRDRRQKGIWEWLNGGHCHNK
jgi:hypothetical protein